MKKDISRRETLRAGAAVAGLGIVGSLSGCSAVENATPLGGASYQAWLPEPGTIGDSDHYRFSFVRPREIANNEDEFDEDVFARYEDREDRFPLEDMGVDFDEVNWSISGFASGVLKAEFNKEDVIEELEDNDYDDEDEIQGYTLMVKEESEDRGVAVSGDTVVHASLGFSGEGNEDVEDHLEAVIETKNGDEDRYTNDSDAFSELVNKLGSGTLVFGRTSDETDDTDEESGDFEGEVASGTKLTVNGEVMNAKLVIVFDEQDNVDVDDVEEWTDEDETFDDFDDINVSQNGRSVVINAKIDTDDFGTS